MFRNNIGIMCILLLAAACTQQRPAQIVMKGSESYSRGVQSSSSSSSIGRNPAYRSPVPETTEQSVAVDSIGISDLSPPPSTKTQVKSEPFSAPSKPLDEPRKNDGVVTKPTTNPWTNKPRSENETPKIEGKEEITIAANEEIKQELKAEAKEETKTTEKKTPAPKGKSSTALKWPVSGKKIISSFGEKGAGKANDGINIAAKEGDAVWAVADGEVVYVNDMKDYGTMVLLKHAGGKTSSYAHLSRANVDKYTRVKQGDIIGYVGKTGSIKTPQLFFSLYKGKTAIDPQKYLE